MQLTTPLQFHDGKTYPVLVSIYFLWFYRQNTTDQAVNENELVAARGVKTWSHGSINHESIFSFGVNYGYSVRSSILPVNVLVLTLPLPLPDTQPESLTLGLQTAEDKDNSFNHTADDYLVMVTSGYLFCGGLLLSHNRLLPRADPVSVLGHTQYKSLQQLQWPMLGKGCLYPRDN